MRPFSPSSPPSPCLAWRSRRAPAATRTQKTFQDPAVTRPRTRAATATPLPGDTQSLPADTQSDFAAEGDDGAAAANLAQSTGPDGNAPNGGGQGAGQADDASTASGNSGSDGSGSDSGSGFGEAVVELVGGSDDGMGLLLPIILGSVAGRGRGLRHRPSKRRINRFGVTRARALVAVAILAGSLAAGTSTASPRKPMKIGFADDLYRSSNADTRQKWFEEVPQGRRLDRAP